jgi:DNA adenine methylase
MQTALDVPVPVNLSAKVAKPFMKWAGGKSQLITALVNFFPPELGNGQIKKYVEPFIGGTLFFGVCL